MSETYSTSEMPERKEHRGSTTVRDFRARQTAGSTRPGSSPSQPPPGGTSGPAAGGNHPLPDDAVARLFEPELITPGQHRDQVQRERVDQPEIRLMLAVMEDAVATYQRYASETGRRSRRLFEEAERWINSTDTAWPYSFENICEALRFEPETVRRGLRDWRSRQQEQGARGMYRFPFRRVNGKRHSISLRDRSLKKSA